jgi:hypothetical protein
MIIVKHPLPVSVGEMEYFLTFLSVGTDDWLLQRLKYITEVWRPLKHEYHSNACSVLMKLSDYSLSNASLISNIIFAIITSMFDR